MKKAFLALIIFPLLFVPAVGDASYLLLLKNGGRLTTPLYWVEGRQLYFFYAGGLVGIERGEIVGVEKQKQEAGADREAPEPPNKKEPTSTTSGIEKTPGPEELPVANIPEEKINIADYKRRKDQMEMELEDLLEKRREAKSRKDDEERKKLTEEILKTSSQIYQLTDEVTAKNKGKLPEDWWVK